MKHTHRLAILGSLGLLAAPSQAQVTLTSAGYLETFDALGAGLPAGWSVRTGATATSPGTPVAFSGVTYAWNGTGGGYHNYASTDGLGSGATTALQAAATDRALGLRQTSSVGDPGAAFVLQIADTLGYQDFQLAFVFHLVDEEGRVGTWTVDYALGPAPASFSPLGTFSRDLWGSQPQSFFLPGEVNDQAQPLWLRVAALNAATGSGSRDSVALDDFALRYGPSSVVPEPGAWALAASVGLLGLCAWRRVQRRS
jgi:trimeric autotransporter adhesin